MTNYRSARLLNRPLALIEGALALPFSRPLSGCRRLSARGDGRRRAAGTRPATGNAGRAAIHAKAAQPRRRNPPNNRFRFFYKLPQRPNSDSRFDEQLAEARHYLPRWTTCVRIRRVRIGCLVPRSSWAAALRSRGCWRPASTHDVADQFATAAKPSATSTRTGRVTVQPIADVQPGRTQADATRGRSASTCTRRRREGVIVSDGSVTASRTSRRHSGFAATTCRLAQRNAGTQRHIAADNRLARSVSHCDQRQRRWRSCGNRKTASRIEPLG